MTDERQSRVDVRGVRLGRIIRHWGRLLGATHGSEHHEGGERNDGADPKRMTTGDR